MFINGDGVDKDAKRSVEYMEKAAEQGYPDAPFCIGMMYKEGIEGVVQDVELGVKWWEKGAEQGDRDAQAFLGKHYLETGEYEKSVPYLEKAAAQGNSVAQFVLGVCYAKGVGVEQNDETSSDFILEAVEAESGEAQA